MGVISAHWRLLLGSLIILSVACNALSGASDLAASSPGEETIAGEQSDSGGGAANSPTDAGPLLKDVSVEIVDACGTDGCFDLPSGFTLVAFSGGGGGNTVSDSCPTGFGQSLNTVENPVVDANACSCGCNITTQPTCPLNGSIANGFSRNNSLTCDLSGVTYANNGCGTEGVSSAFSPGDSHRFTPPAPTGARCASPGTADMTKLTSAQGRMCQATTLPSCAGKICPAPITDPAFKACVASTGDVACPTDFPTKHLVGASASFTCSSNGCGCNVTAKCTGKLLYYTSADCSGTAIFDIIADDTCRATSYPAYTSHKYVPDAPSNVVCAKTGTSTPSAPVLASTTTVCCK